MFQNLNRASMFAVLHLDINSFKSGGLYLTRQPNCKKGRSAKVKDGIINLILRNCLVDRYTCGCLPLTPLSNICKQNCEPTLRA